MKQSLETIQNQKQKFSSKPVPLVKILALSQHELESLIDASLMDSPPSDVDQNIISLKTRDVDLGFKQVRKRRGELQEIAYTDESQDDLFEYVIVQLYPYMQVKKGEEVFTVSLEFLDSRGSPSEAPDGLCRPPNIKETRLLQHLHVPQYVDPKGPDVRGIGEYICIQLSEIGGSILAQHTVCSHLEALSTGDLLKIVKSEHTNVGHVGQASSLIRPLNPIPANGSKIREETVFTIPDVYMRKEDSMLLLEMSARLQGKPSMNAENYELYESAACNTEVKAPLKEKLNDFKWLQYSISRRPVTLKKAIAFLVEYRAAFFRTKDECALKLLRPVNIAEQLKAHTSTISRAIPGKFFQHEYGIYSFHFLVPKCYER